MRREHKVWSVVAGGCTVAIFGAVLLWGRTQSSTDASQNVTIGELGVRQEAMATDIGEIKTEQIAQRDTLTTILFEVKKRNGGE